MEFDLTTKEGRKKYIELILNLTATGFSSPRSDLITKEYQDLINQFIGGKITLDEFLALSEKEFYEIR